MKNYLIYIATLLCAFPHFVMAQEKDSLTAFIEKNPNAIDYNIIYEGSKLNLSADEDYLLVNLSIAHPALQMRFLMQSVSLYIDPSGKKRKNYQIILPNALDVKDELESVMPQNPEGDHGEERPDIRPLIGALNRESAQYLANGISYRLGFQSFHIEMDQQHDLLNFYILLPKEKMMQDRKLSEKWAIGIFSVNNFDNMPPPDPQGPGESGMMPPPMEGEDQQSIQELMQSDIRVWIKFSIDDVNNANLKE